MKHLRPADEWHSGHSIDSSGYPTARCLRACFEVMWLCGRIVISLTRYLRRVAKSFLRFPEREVR